MKCSADPACVFPATELGMCRYHENDLESDVSMQDVTDLDTIYELDSISTDQGEKESLIGFSVRTFDYSASWYNQLRTGRETMEDAAPVKQVFTAAHKRRRLPEERESKTHKFDVAGVRCYLTVGLYEDGMPGEIFLKIDKVGSTVHGFAESWAILFSIALQHGVPLQELVNKFKHVRFQPAGVTNSQTEILRFADSIIDYVVRWMEMKFLKGNGHKDHWANQYTGQA